MVLHHQPLLSTDHEGKPIDVRHENPDILPNVVQAPEIFIQKPKKKKIKRAFKKEVAKEADEMASQGS